MNILKCTILLALISINSLAQEIRWQKSIGGAASDDLDAIEAINGGFILGGTSQSGISGDKTETNMGSDYWIVRMDLSGNIIWQNTIGGSSGDNLRSIHKTFDGGFIIGGYSNSFASGDKSEDAMDIIGDLWIVKVDSVGNIEWENTIGGNNQDYLYEIKQTHDGGYIVAANSISDSSGDKTENAINGSGDFWILKLDSVGNIVWQNTIGGSATETKPDIIQTSDGGFLLGGTSNSPASGDKSENNIGLQDYWIIKLDSTGNIQWENTMGGNMDDLLESVIQTNDSGYLIAGTSSSGISGDKTEPNTGFQDYWILKLNTLGNIVWQRTIGGTKAESLYEMTATQEGGIVLIGLSVSDICDEKSENDKGYADMWIMKMDSAGNIQWDNTIGTDDYDIPAAVCQLQNGDFIFGGNPGNGNSHEITTVSNGGSDYWISCITSDYNMIKGSLFCDMNNNLIYDSGDVSIANYAPYELISGRFSYSSETGEYRLSVLDSGNFSVNPPVYRYYTPVPNQHNVHFNGIHQTDSLNDFGYQAIPGINDLSITITPLNNFRAGSLVRYKIHYQNQGTTNLSPQIIFSNPATLSFYSSSITPDSIVGDSVFWSVPSLSPFASDSITVTFLVNFSVTIGQLVNSEASINPVAGDTIPQDNISNWTSVVRGSFDPNDVLVNEDTLTTSDVAFGVWLDYIIHFQNTGTDTAINIKINNPLPENTDYYSFEFIDSSHPVTLNYKNQDKSMWFEFKNIMLPDSNTDEEGSHGFVRYRIKPLNTLVSGNQINNSANIYFDYNAPVVTNTAVTSVVLSTGIMEVSNDRKVKLFPNPVTVDLNIAFSLKSFSNVEIELFDFCGRLIMNRNQWCSAGNNQVAISTSSVTSGLYFIKVNMDGESQTLKFIKE
jgi:uncharacterized repeat protein (TIGR01451 family)